MTRRLFEDLSPEHGQPGTSGETAPDWPGVELIVRHLALILDSPRFRRAPLLQRILQFVVEESLAGERGTLDATVIARRALGRGNDFISSRDASVRVAMNRLRTTLALYYAAEGANDDVVIELRPGSYSPDIRRRSQDPRPASSREALDLAETYQHIMTPAANSSVLRALQAALESCPDDPDLLAAYVDMCRDAYEMGFNTIACPLERATMALERAIDIAPDNANVLFQRALVLLLYQDLTGARELGDRLLRSHTGELYGAWIISHTKCPTEMPNGLDVTIDVSANAPGWIHHAPFLAAYHSGDYEAALGSAINVGLPTLFWGPLERSAVLAQLGINETARSQLQRAISLNPDFVNDARWYLGHRIKHEDVLEHLLEGLRKAGLGSRDFPTRAPL